MAWDLLGVTIWQQVQRQPRLRKPLTKASAVLVRLVPEEFAKLLTRVKDPLMVIAGGCFFSKNFPYQVSYKGLAFFTRAANALALPPGAEVVSAGRIWIPG